MRDRLVAAGGPVGLATALHASDAGLNACVVEPVVSRVARGGSVAPAHAAPGRGAGPPRGDAAGYVEALTGEGIALGLARARAVGAAVDQPVRPA